MVDVDFTQTNTRTPTHASARVPRVPSHTHARTSHTYTTNTIKNGNRSDPILPIVRACPAAHAYYAHTRSCALCQWRHTTSKPQLRPAGAPTTSSRTSRPIENGAGARYCNSLKLCATPQRPVATGSTRTHAQAAHSGTFITTTAAPTDTCVHVVSLTMTTRGQGQGRGATATAAAVTATANGRHCEHTAPVCAHGPPTLPRSTYQLHKLQHRLQVNKRFDSGVCADRQATRMHIRNDLRDSSATHP